VGGGGGPHEEDDEEEYQGSQRVGYFRAHE
jgi:hypothetical protein